MYLLLALFLIILESVYEGLKMKGGHKESGIVEFFYRASVTVILFGWLSAVLVSPAPLHHPDHIWKILIGYLFLRFALFDLILNFMADIPINYIGYTKWYDLTIHWILNKMKWKGKYILPPEHVIFIRFILFIWGGLWLLLGNTDVI